MLNDSPIQVWILWPDYMDEKALLGTVKSFALPNCGKSANKKFVGFFKFHFFNQLTPNKTKFILANYNRRLRSSEQITYHSAADAKRGKKQAIESQSQVFRLAKNAARDFSINRCVLWQRKFFSPKVHVKLL